MNVIKEIEDIKEEIEALNFFERKNYQRIKDLEDTQKNFAKGYTDFKKEYDLIAKVCFTILIGLALYLITQNAITQAFVVALAATNYIFLIELMAFKQATKEVKK